LTHEYTKIVTDNYLHF
uniref:Uncharacterized protein n=1 Tax=Amphimedon queenslandica TaxID=400682 RepID=A0A1X7VSE8_AMPQE